MTQQAKVYEVQRGVNDQIAGFRPQQREMPVLENYDPITNLLEREGSRYPMRLHEALVLKPDAASILRDGIRFLAFSTMRGIPKTWDQIARVESSDKPEEEYLRDGAMGVIPIKPSGEPVDFAVGGFEGGTKITNYLRRIGRQVTGDDIKFDRIGKVRQIAFEMGRAAVATEEATFYDVVTTTGNYTRNSTTGDNDVGSNTGTTTFNALGLDTAFTTISTSKDRVSGQYLGYNADTLITTPKMEFPVKQMLLSDYLMVTTSAGVRGMGTTNPYMQMGMLKRIIVSPWFGTSYQWALVDTNAYSFVWQQVLPWQILQDNMNGTSEAWLVNNAIRYVIQGHFGLGFVDDRAWYYSDSTTAPTVS